MTIVRHDGVVTGTGGPVRPRTSFRNAPGRLDDSLKALCGGVGGTVANVLFKETVTECVTRDGEDLPRSQLMSSERPNHRHVWVLAQIERDDGLCSMCEAGRRKEKTHRELCTVTGRPSDHLDPFRHT